MAHANVIVHQRTGAGQIFLKGVVLDTVLIRPSTVQSSVGLQTHLIADHQVCPVSEEHFGAAGLAVGRDLVGNLVRHTKEVASVHLIAVDVVAGGGLDVLEIALHKGVESPAQSLIVHVLAHNQRLHIDREIGSQLTVCGILGIHLLCVDFLNAGGVGNAGGLELAAGAVQSAPVKAELHTAGQISGEQFIGTVLGAHQQFAGLGHNGFQTLCRQAQVAECRLSGSDLATLTAPHSAGAGGHARDVQVAVFQRNGACAQLLDDGLAVQQFDDLIQIDFRDQEAASGRVGGRHGLELAGHGRIVVVLLGVKLGTFRVMPAEDIQTLDGAGEVHQRGHTLLLLLGGSGAAHEQAGVLTLGRSGAGLHLTAECSGLAALGIILRSGFVVILFIRVSLIVILALRIGFIIVHTLICGHGIDDLSGFLNDFISRQVADFLTGILAGLALFVGIVHGLFDNIGHVLCGNAIQRGGSITAIIAGIVLLAHSFLDGALDEVFQLIGAHLHRLDGGCGLLSVLQTH